MTELRSNTTTIKTIEKINHALYVISVIIAFLMIVPSLTPIVIVRSVSAQLPPAITPHGPGTSNAGTVTINTTNVIQGSNNLLKSQEPMIKRAIAAAIGNAVLITKGSITSHIPASVNAKVVNQLDNNRVSTTQGINFTRSVVALAVANAIDTMMKKSNTTTTGTTVTEHQVQRVVIDNQAICSGIASPTSAACNFIIDLHR